MKSLLLTVTALCVPYTCPAQTAPSSFEVASIRPNRSGAAQFAMFFEAGRFRAENAPIRRLVAYAYNLKEFQVAGGPSWLDSERYDIVATEEDSAAKSMQKLPWKQYREQLGLLVQSLLVDRFKLSVLHQPKELRIYALVAAKDGPKLSRSSIDTYSSDIRGHRGNLIAKRLSLAQLADILSWETDVDERKVVDQTGIEGTFDLTLRWSPPPPAAPVSPGGAPPDHTYASGPTIFTALEEQLGLKLQPTKGPVDFLVVDHIEKPSEN